MRKKLVKPIAAGVVTLVIAGIITFVWYSNKQEKPVDNPSSSSSIAVEEQSSSYEVDLAKVHCPFDGYVEKYKADNNLTELNDDQQYDLFDTMFMNGETPDQFDCDNEYLEAYKAFYAERLAEQQAMEGTDSEQEVDSEQPTETEKPTETESEAEQTGAFENEEALHNYVEKQFGAEAAEIVDWTIQNTPMTLESFNDMKEKQGEWFDSVLEGQIESYKSYKENEEYRKENPFVDPEVTKESLKNYKETGSVQG